MKMNASKSPQSFGCDLCDNRFRYKRTLHRHLREVHLEEPPVALRLTGLPCRYCDELLCSVSSLRRHERRIHPHGAQDLRCTHCLLTFKRKDHLIAHFSKKVCKKPGRAVKSLVCEECGKVSKNRIQLRHHMNQVHESKKVCKKPGRAVKSLVCEECGKVSKNRRQLRNHMNQMHESSYTCSLCKRMYKRKDSLEFHIWKYHLNLQPDNCIKKQLSENNSDNQKKAEGYESASTSDNESERSLMSDELAAATPSTTADNQSGEDTMETTLGGEDSALAISTDSAEVFSPKPLLQMECCSEPFTGNDISSVGTHLSCGHDDTALLRSILYLKSEDCKLDDVSSPEEEQCKAEVDQSLTCKVEEDVQLELVRPAAILDDPNQKCVTDSEIKVVKEELCLNNKHVNCEVDVENVEECNGTIKNSEENTRHSKANSCESASQSREPPKREANKSCPCVRCRMEMRFKQRYTCNTCGKSYVDQMELRRHIQRKCNTLSLVHCKICVRGFCNRISLRQHVALKHSQDVKQYKCEKCQTVYQNYQGFKNHITKHHPSKPKDNSPKTCDICQRTLSNAHSLMNHVRRSHYATANFVCTHCKQAFTNKESLKVHFQSYHPVLYKCEYKCEVCAREFSGAGSLSSHVKNIHSGKRFCCEACGKAFSTKDSLISHIVIHTDLKPFVCESCGKCFRRKNNLDQHQIIHTDRRPFSCALCSAAFRIRHHLRQHMAVHGMASIYTHRRGRGLNSHGKKTVQPN